MSWCRLKEKQRKTQMLSSVGPGWGSAGCLQGHLEDMALLRRGEGGPCSLSKGEVQGAVGPWI